MKYNFKERHLGSEFCKKRVVAIKKLINTSISFTTVGMPGLGISIFLRYVATQPFAHFVHVDVYELSALTRIELVKLLLKELGTHSSSKNYEQLLKACQKRLEDLTKTHTRVVIIFNRFDQMHKEFDISFFNNLRTLRDVDREKIVMIFAANKPLYMLAPQAIDKGNLNMYSKTLYLIPYSTHDLRKLLVINAPELTKDKVSLEKALKLCGGHYQLLQLLLKSERLENPLFDHFVKTQLKLFYDYLTYDQRKIVQKIALRKKVTTIDEYLVDVGLVVKYSHSYHLFTPLLTEFVQSNIPLRLPVKEAWLFRLLKKNLGKVVPKDELFETVWPEDPVEASEWALNALIYRLRKNPTFAQQGYVIENHKKVGYMMIKT
ncbi:helix-turn-helix domain-containing protein [Candidatus Microgenomates bacterium]|nr:helix-turn-helix domain-containing protein [Candidatus Microgenomates bacterium]